MGTLSGLGRMAATWIGGRQSLRLRSRVHRTATHAGTTGSAHAGTTGTLRIGARSTGRTRSTH
jgi:hypothetical protein